MAMYPIELIVASIFSLQLEFQMAYAVDEENE